MYAGFPFHSLIENIYLPLFHNDGENALKILCTLSVPKLAFLAAYKKLDPIPKSQMKGMSAYVDEILPNLSSDDKADACKIIYTIGTLL